MLKDIKINYDAKQQSVTFTKEVEPISATEVDEAVGYTHWRFRKEVEGSEWPNGETTLILKLSRRQPC